MDWQPAPEKLIDLIEDDIADTVLEAKYTRLPFYQDGYLVDVGTLDGNIRVVLGGTSGLSTAVLDGTGPQIKMANMIAGLSLTRENVADYVRFFCGHLKDREGRPFRIIETADGKALENGHRLRAMSIKVRHQEPNGSFRVGAYQMLNEELYRVSLRVLPGGRVDMLDDVALGRFISTRH